MTWLLAIAGAALCFMVPGTADPYQTPRLLVLAALCVPLLLRRSRHGLDFALGAPVGLALALWLAAGIWTRDAGATLVGSYLAPFDGLTAVAVSLAILVGAARLGVAAEHAAGAICLASLPLSLYALAQAALGSADPLLPGPLPDGRVVAAHGSPVYLGAVLAVVAAVAMAECVNAEDENRQSLAAVALGLALPAIWYTHTRGAVLAVLAAAAVMLPRRARWALPGVLPLLLLLPRLHAAASDSGRFEVWRLAWKIFRAHPLAGTGPGTFGMSLRAVLTPKFVAIHHNALISQQHAHNQLLQVLATTGLLGLAAYLVVAGAVARVIWAAPDDDRRILGAAVAAYLTLAAVNPVPHAATVLLCLLLGTSASREALRPAGVPWLPLAGALASLVLTAHVAAADWHVAQAARLGRAQFVEMAEHFNRAAQLDPWEIRNTAQQLDAAEALAQMMPAAQRAQVLGACVGIANDALLLHPHDSFAHESRGKAVLVAAMYGLQQDPREALDEFDQAQALAPTFMPLMLRRRALARALQLPDAADRADRELAQIRKWEAGWL